jgi:error-prone DNA polymerase
MWAATGRAPGKGLLREAAVGEEPLQLAAPSEAENHVSDYQHLDLT